MTTTVKILVGAPVVEIIAQQALHRPGIEAMAKWVQSRRPECMPDGYRDMADLFPHDMAANDDGRDLSANELLVELAGRKCYDSFGAKAGRKSNQDYIAHTQDSEVPHASILYHAKFSFFLAGISRRMSHELIRNYVGSDRDEEGAPSQESTRYTKHHGTFVCPPAYLDQKRQALFTEAMQFAYDQYLSRVDEDVGSWTARHGESPKGQDRKRILEAAAAMLPPAAETSFIWTTNPMAIAKLVRERAHPGADAEFQRFAETYARAAVLAAPNLFPQPWMQRFF